MPDIPDRWKWFSEARFGMFIHWGPYAAYGRGEQVLFRERLPQRFRWLHAHPRRKLGD